MYIPKYILNFAAVLVLTLNATLMKYKISYVGCAGTVYSYISFDSEVFELLRLLEKCTIKSFTISLAESAQKGGQYEQQPE